MNKIKIEIRPFNQQLSRAFLISNFSLLILLSACPNPPEETLCGQGMILSADTCVCIENAHLTESEDACECDSLYNWDEDAQQCLRDTTSHNFTWTIDTLGAYGSLLNDVHIVNENDIWVVGKIRIPDPDSSYNGTGWETFNAAHWDGDEWEYIKILSGNSAVSTIYYFSQNDIWTSIGSFPVHWDGTDWTIYHLQDMGLDAHIINSSWGSSTSNMYFVGIEGSIVHYDGGEFTKMESGTDTNLRDVCGIGSEDNTISLWASGMSATHGTTILSLNDNTWSHWFTRPFPECLEFDEHKISGTINGIWTDSNKDLWAITMHGLYQINTENPDDFMIYPAPEIAWGDYINNMDGSASNNIFFSGQNSNIWHFNGVSLYDCNLPGDVELAGIDVNSNMVCAVGRDVLIGNSSSSGIVIRGFSVPSN